MNISLKRSSVIENGFGVGISLYEDGICIAYPGLKSKPTPKVEFFSVQGEKSQTRMLRKIVSKHKLHSIPATVVMNHTNYNLLQVPTPQVNKDEIDAALRWQIKDLVDIDVENSIIRSYPMPGQGNITSPLIFVVIADRSAIKNITEMVYDAGLNIKSVTSVELGLRSLLKAIEDIKVPTMLLAIFPHKTVFIHMVNGVLYRTRELNYGATHLPGSGSWSEDESWPERLVTEVGRFIIFCARHCDGGSAQRLLVTSTVSSSPDLVEALAEETELVVEELSHGLIDVRCLPALGVAYEGMEQ